MGMDAWAKVLATSETHGLLMSITSKSISDFFEVFIAIPFGAALTLFYGHLLTARLLMIVDDRGIRFSMGSGKIIAWDQITSIFAGQSGITIIGVGRVKEWEKTFPKWLVDGDCEQIAAEARRLGSSTQYTHSPNKRQ